LRNIESKGQRANGVGGGGGIYWPQEQLSPQAQLSPHEHSCPVMMAEVMLVDLEVVLNKVCFVQV